MPRKKKTQRDAQIERNRTIIRNATKIKFGGLARLANEMGIKYSTLYSSLQSGSIKAVDMAGIIRILRLDNETVLALMGNPKKCRYEVGYESV